MKKLASLLFAIVMLILNCSPICYADDEITVYINGEKINFDVPPVIVDDRTLVPMRALFEALGADVSWDDESQTASGRAEGIYVNITIGSPTFLRNSLTCDLDVPAQVINDRTLIPLRVVGEAFGMNVNYDDRTQVITMESSGRIKKYDWSDNCYYFGEVFLGKPHGYGALYKKDTGDLRECGYFNSSESNYMRKGIAIYDNGDSYYGELSTSGHHEGKGIYTYDDGVTYTGEFKDGQENGMGVFTNNDKEYKIVSNFLNGKINGYALIIDLAFGDSSIKFYDNITPQIEEVEQQKAQIEAERDKALLELYNKQVENNNAYYDQMTELYDMLDTDPTKTKIYRDAYNAVMSKYDLSAIQGRDNAAASAAASNGGNIDSFAAANAARQQAALTSQAKKYAHQAGMAAYNSYISEVESALNLAKGQSDDDLAEVKKNLNAIYDNDIAECDNKITMLNNELDRLIQKSSVPDFNAIIAFADNFELRAE